MRRVAGVRLSVVLGQWLDRPLQADLEVAVEADRLGFPELWIGEMAKVDAPVMAAAVIAATEQIVPCLGPLAVTVRTAAQIALATASVAALGGRPVNVAIGTSSDVVARWHGRTRTGASDLLGRALTDLRAIFGGDRIDGFHLRALPPTPSLTVAAFGPKAVATAAGADRMALNMVTAPAAAKLATQHPHTTVWLAAAVDPDERERRWMANGYVGYLAAPGYSEMFADAGFAELVEFAKSRPHPKLLAERIPDELLDAVALVGSESNVQRRIEEYAAAAVAEIGLVVPPLDLPSGRATLEALAPR